MHLVLLGVEYLFLAQMELVPRLQQMVLVQLEHLQTQLFGLQGLELAVHGLRHPVPLRVPLRQPRARRCLHQAVQGMIQCRRGIVKLHLAHQWHERWPTI